MDKRRSCISPLPSWATQDHSEGQGPPGLGTSLSVMLYVSRKEDTSVQFRQKRINVENKVERKDFYLQQMVPLCSCSHKRNISAPVISKMFSDSDSSVLLCTTYPALKPLAV